MIYQKGSNLIKGAGFLDFWCPHDAALQDNVPSHDLSIPLFEYTSCQTEDVAYIEDRHGKLYSLYVIHFDVIGGLGFVKKHGKDQYIVWLLASLQDVVRPHDYKTKINDVTFSDYFFHQPNQNGLTQPKNHVNELFTEFDEAAYFLFLNARFG